MAVAIEGDIFQDAYQAQLGPEREIYLIPKIGGGAFPKPRLRGNQTLADPANRRPIASPAFPLIDVFGPLFGEIGPLFTRVGYRLVSI